MTTRTIYNKFGFRKVFFDRIDSVLPQALAWIPQSTVGLVIDKAWDNLTQFPAVQVLLQVHDSLMYQIQRQAFLDLLPEIHKAMLIEVPYDDPLVIPIGLSVSAVSWGDCVDIEWNGKFVEAKHACRVRRGKLI